MDNIEKKFLKDHNIVDRISFKDGQAHQVKIVKRKLDSIDNQGVVKEGIKYMVLENNEPKTFFTSAISLIQILSEIEDGRVVIIQMKSKPNGQGGFTSYFDVKYPQTEMKAKEDIEIVEEQQAEPEW